jgi:hypothetical protein
MQLAGGMQPLLLQPARDHMQLAALQLPQLLLLLLLVLQSAC